VKRKTGPSFGAGAGDTLGFFFLMII